MKKSNKIKMIAIFLWFFSGFLYVQDRPLALIILFLSLLIFYSANIFK